MTVFFESIEPRQLMSSSPLLSKLDDAVTGRLPEVAVSSSQNGKTVTGDMSAALKTAAAPSTAALKKLKTDAAAAFADKKLSDDEKALLVSDVKAVLTSGHVSGKLAKLTGVDLSKMFADKSVPVSDDNTVVSQLVSKLTALKK